MFKKMIRILLAAAMAGFWQMGAMPIAAHANSYTVALTTYVPTASAADYTLGAYPNIANSLYLRQLVIANNSATAQDITVYNNCTSSAAADTVMFHVSLPATIGTYYFPSGNVILPNGLTLTNPCIARSATTGTTWATFLYE